MFGWDFEVDAWSRFWRWIMIKICVWTCDMNSTLGSVVPLAMFFDSTLNSISLTCWRAVIMVVAMPVIYNDCGEASNDCKIVVTDLKTDNYLWQALTLKCWWLNIALKSHLFFLCFTLSFYIFKGTWSNETLTKKTQNAKECLSKSNILAIFVKQEEVQRTTKQLLFNLLLLLTYMIVRAHVVALNTLASTLKTVDSTTHLIVVHIGTPPHYSHL